MSSDPELELPKLGENERAALSRSFLIGYETDLVRATRKIVNNAPQIGFPNILIEDMPGLEYCSVEAGFEHQPYPVPLWEINMRTNESNNAILHGRITQTGDDWRYLTISRQGVRSHEAYIVDDEAALDKFVLRAITAARIDEASQLLIEVKEAKRVAHDEYVQRNMRTSRSWKQKNAKAQKLFDEYSRVGFMSLGVSDLSKVKVHSANRRKINIRVLDEWIQQSLEAENFTIKVPAEPSLTDYL